MFYWRLYSLLMRTWIELSVVVAANVLGAAMSLPQAIRLLRTRVVHGVSGEWALLSLVSNAWWVAYGVGRGQWAIVPVAAASVIGYLFVALALVRFGGWRGGRLTLVVAATVAVAPAVTAALSGWVAVGIVLGVLYAVQLTPAVVMVCRRADLSGVAAGTWVFAWTEAALWGTYGIRRGDSGVLTLAASGIVMSSVVLARLIGMVVARRGIPLRLALASN